jgi:broad specificity phosphatase PhoE
MKWPNSITFIRHGESGYNILNKIKKDENSAFSKFEKLFWRDYELALDENWVSAELKSQAKLARQELFAVFSDGDYMTPLTEEGFVQAEKTGEVLSKQIKLPNIIYVSPYLRTRQTLEMLTKGWPELAKVRTVSEERVRELEHGLATIYNDWKLYLVYNPEQAILMKRGHNYEYRFLNGENKSDVRERMRSFLTTLVRENANEDVLIVSHHLALLALRATLERWDREEFGRVDREEKPINCGVTIYEGVSGEGRDGKLKLRIYNSKLY